MRESERNEIRNLVIELREKLASLREDLSNANRRIHVLESWRNRIIERFRELRSIWGEQTRNESRDFSSSVEGHLNHCDICMG